MGCDHRELINGKGCYHFDAEKCKCTYQFYRCPEFIARTKFDISYSQIRTWDRCPVAWYLDQIEGIRVKEAYQSPEIRMGSEFSRLIGKPDDPPVYFSDKEYTKKAFVHTMYKVMVDYKMFPENALYEVDLTKDNFHGILDCMSQDGSAFGEYKFTGSPDFYLNNMLALDQLEGYFYLKDSLKTGYMLPVRVPKLRQGKDESEEKLVSRAEDDIRRRMGFYFPGFRMGKKPFMWGRVFSRIEFDFPAFEKKVQWTIGEIQRCCAADYWPHKSGNCMTPFPCDYLRVCEAGAINWEVFERRTD